ncbi:MAG: uracil-DNA glycosylase [Alphaproteobacteria bacterium]|nr:uracil-DNA glycosylase [Alphaproteobacteria bacterium]
MKAPLTPSSDCPLCPRLAAFRRDNRKKHPDWFNAPVPCFGPRTARLAIAGLAPGLQGANRTGRPFTGDWAGDLLYETLLKLKLAKGSYEERADDTLELIDCRIVNSVRCVPPQNKPEPSEIRTCRQFLISELDGMPNLNTILALGKIAHDSVLKTLDARISAHPFKHGAVYEIGKFRLISSYHCSRYNTNTGVLTTEMFETVVAKAKKLAAIA